MVYGKCELGDCCDRLCRNVCGGCHGDGECMFVRDAAGLLIFLGIDRRVMPWIDYPEL